MQKQGFLKLMLRMFTYKTNFFFQVHDCIEVKHFDLYLDERRNNVAKMDDAL